MIPVAKVAEDLRQRLREAEATKQKILSVLKELNAIACLECNEPADPQSKRCSRHRILHRRMMDRERQRRHRSRMSRMTLTCIGEEIAVPVARMAT